MFGFKPVRSVDLICEPIMREGDGDSGEQAHAWIFRHPDFAQRREIMREHVEACRDCLCDLVTLPASSVLETGLDVGARIDMRFDVLVVRKIENVAAKPSNALMPARCRPIESFKHDTAGLKFVYQCVNAFQTSFVSILGDGRRAPIDRILRPFKHDPSEAGSRWMHGKNSFMMSLHLAVVSG